MSAWEEEVLFQSLAPHSLLVVLMNSWTVWKTRVRDLGLLVSGALGLMPGEMSGPSWGLR